MKSLTTRYEDVDGVKMEICTFRVFEEVNGMKVPRIIETRNAVDTFGLN